ncbi:hypothetical protein [Cyanobium sp. ATX 6F1]|uniref:hypothetical protein n=1 Tax=unclassified Cyanobium TaxID=2627006 RepID=UPI0020CDFBA2|nr:hypothetical protein [Cyanobium sp. ATX 6F1]MCP9917132.1 hypothetical protein [Cyanobium sp. ATX 6F1]
MPALVSLRGPRHGHSPEWRLWRDQRSDLIFSCDHQDPIDLSAPPGAEIRQPLMPGVWLANKRHPHGQELVLECQLTESELIGRLRAETALPLRELRFEREAEGRDQLRVRA